MDKKENRCRPLLVVALIVAAVLGYLFALNGRYMLVRDTGIVVDKWKHIYYIPGDDGKFVPRVSLNYEQHNINN